MHQKKYFKALRPLLTVLSIKGLLDVAFVLYCTCIAGTGFGLELPCEFKFQGENFSCDWLKEKLKKENFDVL